MEYFCNNWVEEEFRKLLVFLFCLLLSSLFFVKMKDFFLLDETDLCTKYIP